MSDRLKVEERQQGFGLVWVDDDDEEGAWVGEWLRPILTCPEVATLGDSWDYFLAEYLAQQDSQATRVGTAFSWESRSAAAACLFRFKAAVKVAKTDVPWPEWAVTAAAAGWKPPRGWKP